MNQHQSVTEFYNPVGEVVKQIYYEGNKFRIEKVFDPTTKKLVSYKGFNDLEGWTKVIQVVAGQANEDKYVKTFINGT